MKNRIETIVSLIVFFVNINIINSQVIITQDFEGPLTGGWMSNGSIVSAQNSINAYAGSGMLALGQQKSLSSPAFTLPAGSKNLSFWLNISSPSVFASIGAMLTQNSNTVVNLGTWTYLSNWQQITINIPAGYTGNNYAITFSVQSSVSTTNFYLDDINVSAGSFPTGINKNEGFYSDIKIGRDVFNKNTVQLFSNEILENSDLYITTIEGNEIFSMKSINILNSKAFEINLPEINSGVYLLKLKNKDKVIVGKIII